MRIISSPAACLTLALFSVAATPAEPKPTAASNIATPRAESGTAASVKIPQITIDASVKPPVCRRYVPTGSRIATERCETQEESITAAQQTNQDLIRRDVEEMRALQQVREQVRAQALADALRRPAGGQ
jgi:hypothetical protein